MNISFKDFLFLLCIYQIKNKDKYLKNFVILFNKYDNYLYDIINEDKY